ncbi:MAG: tRNA lysidine(34) synthetase TilS [Devosia sp.]
MPGDQLIDPLVLFAPLAGAKAVGLAVSGGADSLALLLLAARWRDANTEAPPLFVYSVDHGLRPEAADEVASVIATAAKLGLPARGLRWSDGKPTTGVQEAARAARYRLIGEAMQADGADLLATGHHLDDQAETVLMRLAHGSGLAGLRGMAPLAEVEGIAVARPLLGVPGDTLAAIVAAAGLTPVADPSNDDPHYERVRWRQALPQLAGLGLDAGRLALFAARAGEAYEAIGQMAATTISQHATARPAGVAIPAAHLAELPRAVLVEVLARLLEQVGGAGKRRQLAQLELLALRLQDGTALKRTTLHGSVILSDGKTVSIVKEAGRRTGFAPSAEINREG